MVPRAAVAGFAAFAAVFGVGFVLGTIRVMVLVPRMGETTSVLCELPIMLAVSWWTVGWAITCWDVPLGRARILMGAAAFTLLLSVEFALGVIAFGEKPAEWLASLFGIPGAIGLAGQIAFGFMPLLRGAAPDTPQSSKL